MTSKFGLKDFVLLVAILAVGLSVWLAMVQRQREWRQLGLVNTKLNELERHLVLMEDRLAAAAASLPASPAPGAPQAAAADTAWARPGVPVTRTGSWSFVHSPLAVEALEPDGTFTEIFEGQPPIITPYRYADVYGRRVVLGLVCESLGAYHPETLKLRGMLADAWQYAPDGTWARVHINPAARFSDGRPVTSEDVRYTYHDFMSNMEIQAERFRSVYSGIQTVTPIDPHTVEFVFKEPRFDNLDQALGFPIIPRHVYEHFTSTQVNQSTGLLLGSGPFKLEGFDPANPAEQWAPPRDIVLVRNESYWGPKPALERIRFKVVQDSLARLTAYTNGEGDMMRPIPIQWDAKVGLDAEGRPKDPDFLEHHNPLKWFNMQGGYSWIGWQCGPRNGKLTPFHDRRVRLAMTHLIDRETIRREIEKG
ncbi:MAG TPA: ABC transporter substrate-binding protein, partial [Phycisphaerales bacterium]|nr:ABC transporter substrate-binding protein [Phycisphaerales bacterium]